jgi:hypothetical protein
MAITKSNASGQIVLSNADYMIVTPYKNDSEIGDTSYDIVDIVADTLSFTPDDNTVNTKEWEFGDSPLVENITLGKIQFAATCVNFNNTVMEKLFGWTNTSGNMYAPSAYKDLFVTLEVGFKNENVAVVVPKLKLNSKAVISTLKTGTGECQLAGTAYEAILNDQKTPMALIARTLGTDGQITEATYTVTIGEKETTFKTGNAETSGVQKA